MRLHEYEGKALLQEAGIEIPAGSTVDTAAAARGIAGELGAPVVIKAQVLAGGRGRDGGIQIAHDADEAVALAAVLLRRPCRGLVPEHLLIERRLPIAAELYAAVTIDPAHGRPVMLLGHGGVDIEDQARAGVQPGRRLVDPLAGPADGEIAALAAAAGVVSADSVAAALRQLWEVFTAQQALTVEVNPLAVLTDGSVVAADAVIEVDDAARELAGLPLRDAGGPVRRERSGGMTFVELGGDVGVICSGAGLGMATMDLISAHATPANFLETGGGISRELMRRAMERVLRCPGLRGVLINVYGGINPIHEGALGVADVMAGGVEIPVVAKALGNHQEETWEILAAAGVTVVREVATEDAVDLLLRQMRERAR